MATPNRSLNAVENLRAKMDRGQPVLGMAANLADPLVSEIAVDAGFDFVWIENEHAYMTTKDVLHHILTLRGTGVAPMVRVPLADAAVIKPYVDLCPAVIVVPFVRSAAETSVAVAACRYPPEGVRGFGPIRNMGHGELEFDEYLAAASRQVMVFVQVEHVDAVNDLDALIATPGLDGICLGRNDLSGSVGKLGQYDAPEVAGMIDTLIEKCQDTDLYLGASLGPDWQPIQRWAERGMVWFSLGSDTSFVAEGARALRAQYQSLDAIKKRL